LNTVAAVGMPLPFRVTSITETKGDFVCVTYSRWLSERIVNPRGLSRSAMPSRFASTSAIVSGKGMSFRLRGYCSETSGASVCTS
jgi:hypothetical protein